MFVTADQLVAHMVGDYIIQSDWMATQKTKQWLAAIIHAATYSLPFFLITDSWIALAIIFGTHAVFDRFRVARYVIYVKNLVGPVRHPWSECSATGYHKDMPPWMSVWLLIIVDNIIHILTNATAIYFFADTGNLFGS